MFLSVLVTFLRIYFKGACTLVTLHLLTWWSGLLEKWDWVTFCSGRWISKVINQHTEVQTSFLILSSFSSQSSYSCLCFQDVLWPEFSVWNFFSAIISYQKNYQAIQDARQRHAEHLKQLQHESDKQCVLAMFEQSGTSGAANLEEDVITYAKHRQERIDRFIEHIQARHREYLEQACRHSLWWGVLCTEWSDFAPMGIILLERKWVWSFNYSQPARDQMDARRGNLKASLVDRGMLSAKLTSGFLCSSVISEPHASLP